MNPISKLLIKNGSDKCLVHTYQYFYDNLFNAIDRNAPIDLLESGIEYGGSLCAWKEYLPNANVTGVDIVDQRLKQYIRDDVEFVVSDIKKYPITKKYDIIIEDGNHSNEDALWAAENLSHHLKDWGWLVIEDVQEGFIVPMIMWGKLHGNFVVNVIDMRRLTNRHDNMLIAIQKVVVNRINNGKED